MLACMSAVREHAVVTLAEREAAKLTRIRASVAALCADLRAYAQAKGGRFVLFGSAARGEVRVTSDVNLAVDFPEALGWEPWAFPGKRAAAFDLRVDAVPMALAGDELRRRLDREGVVLA